MNELNLEALSSFPSSLGSGALALDVGLRDQGAVRRGSPKLGFDHCGKQALRDAARACLSPRNEQAEAIDASGTKKGETAGDDSARFGSSHSGNARNPSGGACAILDIIESEDSNKQVLLEGNTDAKKAPGEDGKSDSSEGIAKQDLCTDGPDEPAEIAGMSAPAIDAVGDEDMVGKSAGLDAMGEGGACGEPGGLAEEVAQEGEEDAGGEEKLEEGLLEGGEVAPG